ncbi:hypothetical protein, partial [Corynebacterium glyciniphilum]
MSRSVLPPLRSLLVPAAVLALAGGGLVPAAGAVPAPAAGSSAVSSLPTDLVDAGDAARQPA